MLCTYPELLGWYRIQVVRFMARNRLSSTRTARSAALAVLPYLMLPCLKGEKMASNGGYDWRASRTGIRDQLFGVSTGPFWSALFADCVLLLIVITYRCLPNCSGPHPPSPRFGGRSRPPSGSAAQVRPGLSQARRALGTGARSATRGAGERPFLHKWPCDRPSASPTAVSIPRRRDLRHGSRRRGVRSCRTRRWQT